MKVKEIMERAGMTQTGRAVAYIKDALDEINISSETHVTTQRIDITADQRFYDLPNDCLKVLDIRCKHHNNEDEKYRSIPRSIYEPAIVDEDGN
tara:strand:+ start:11023 stop:11304 length:282 start_codon:yes stop_codon:yes gene_type:complete